MSFTASQNKLIAAEVSRRVAFAVKAYIDPADRMISSGGGNTEGWRDRYAYNRYQTLLDSFVAWQTNPLARRIVGLTTQYVAGGGLTVECKHPATADFLKLWWNHRLNKMPIRVMEWADELWRSGNLIPLLSTSGDGMTYLRAVPAIDIDDIETAPNDVEQPLRFISKLDPNLTEPRIYVAYTEGNDDGLSARALHYPLNRPVGAKWGEGDLFPLLKWLSRYTGWLDDRARLNHYRQIFLYMVSGKFESAAERLARQAELNASPPTPGSTMVKDESETWEILSPKLDSFEAGADGLTLKKTIAVGAGLPIHFLAEPEGSNRTTAEAAGGPTYRYYEQRQVFFKWVIQDIARIAVARRARVDNSVDPEADITVKAPDISARDNAALANAASTIVASFATLYDRGLIDEGELIRLSYSFAGELVDVQELLKKVVPPRAVAPAAQPASAKAPDDRDTQDLTELSTDRGDRAHALALFRMALEDQPQKEIHLHNHVEPTPISVHVETPPAAVHVEPTPIHVTNEVAPAPVQNIIHPSDVHLTANVQPTPIEIINQNQVDVTASLKLPTVIETSVFERDKDGRAEKIHKTYKQESEE